MLEHLIQQYGYIALFIGTMLEGEVVLIIAGYAAFQGYMSLPIVIVLAFLGSLVSDHTFFSIGRKKGRDFLEGRPRLRKKIRKVYTLLENHRWWLLLGSRFFYGFRIVTPLAIGASPVTRKEFYVMNTLGAAIWAVLFGMGGYIFGSALTLFMSDMRQYEYEIILGIITVALAVWVAVITRRIFFNQIEN